MKTVNITCTWRTHHEVEVPDDFTDNGYLSDFPPEALDEMTSANAELVDWEVRG